MTDGLQCVLLRNTGLLKERTSELLSISTQLQLQINLMAAPFLRGWAMVSAGQVTEGIAEMRQTLSNPVGALSSTGALLLPVLAETCGNNGHVKEALDWVARGLATADRIGLRIAEAELHRVKAHLLLISDPSAKVEAERCLRTAIDIARRQSARLFELRATISLARLIANRAARGAHYARRNLQLVHRRVRYYRPERG